LVLPPGAIGFELPPTTVPFAEMTMTFAAVKDED